MMTLLYCKEEYMLK